MTEHQCKGDGSCGSCQTCSGIPEPAVSSEIMADEQTEMRMVAIPKKEFDRIVGNQMRQLMMTNISVVSQLTALQERCRQQWEDEKHFRLEYMLDPATHNVFYRPKEERRAGFI